MRGVEGEAGGGIKGSGSFCSLMCAGVQMKVSLQPSSNWKNFSVARTMVFKM